MGETWLFPGPTGCRAQHQSYWQGRRKRKPFGNWMRVWADVAETPIPWTGSLQCPWVVSCRDSGCPSSWDEWLGGAARKGLAGHSCCSSSGSSLLLSCEMFCWNAPHVELPWGGALGGSRVCTLLSALVRNVQAGLSVGCQQPDARDRCLVSQGDLLYPLGSLLRSHKV